MAKPKGLPKTGGKQKGTPNKATRLAKEAFAAFVDGNSHRLLEWLEEIESPKDRFNCFMSVAEFHLPKLARTEHTGDEKNPVKVDVTHKLPPEEAYKRLLSE